MLREVSDRLAFLNFLAGSLSGTLSAKLNTARVSLKALRDDEVALTQRRNVRAGLQNQIARLEHSQEKGYEKHIVELKEQLAKAEKDDEPAEREHKILLRKALKESEQQKFQALREVGGLIGARFKSLSFFRSQYGEKLALLSQAADGVLAFLPSVPPSPSQPYGGVEETGTIRASLQHSLDHWKPGQATLYAPAGANLDRSHTQSFGVTHAEELQKINTAERQITPHAHLDSPPLGGSFEPGRDAKPSTALAPSPVPVPTRDLGSTTTLSTTLAKDSPAPVPTQDLGSTAIPSTTSAKDSPINPAVGGNEPAPIPSTAPSVAVISPGPVDTDSRLPSVIPTPTVAETGESSSGAVPKPYESAEEEKRRLERERLLRGDGSSSGPSVPVYESAEEEKKRLEREEREKLLHGQMPGYDESNTNTNTNEGDTPPPYQDI